MFIKGSVNLLIFFNLAKWQDDFKIKEVDPRAKAMIEGANKLNIRISNLKLFNNQTEIFRASSGKKKTLFKHLPKSEKFTQVYQRYIDDKWRAKKALAEKSIPVPKGFLVRKYSKKISKKAKLVGYPLIVKPRKGSLSQGIVRSVRDTSHLKKIIKNNNQNLIVEQECQGREYRITLIAGKFRAACYREPAKVTGDGKKTVEELVKLKNKDRDDHRSSTSKKIKKIKENISLDYVPDKNETVFLSDNVNTGSGAQVYDLTTEVDKENIEMFERVGEIYQADIIGIDYISPDISQPYQEVGGWIIELNSLPYINMHTDPHGGQPQPIAEELWKEVFK